jgi:hypothetical protein
VPPGDEEGHERWDGLRVFEAGGEEVGLHVVHSHHRPVDAPGHRLRPGHSHEERPDEPRPGGHPDGGHLVQLGVGLLQRGLHHGVEDPHVGPGRELGNDPGVDLVHVL